MLMTTNTNTKPKLYVDFDTTMVNSPKILTICYEKLTGIKPLTYTPLDWNIAMAYPNYDKDIIHTIFDISLFFNRDTDARELAGPRSSHAALSGRGTPLSPQPPTAKPTLGHFFHAPGRRTEEV